MPVVRQVNVIQFINHNMKKLVAGFTLLELLVVIGIISILIALGAVSYSTAQKKARDAKRKGDVRAIINAFEQYNASCSYTYPGSLGTSIVTPGTCTNPNITIMATVPTDPLNVAPYQYTYQAGPPIKICATLEAETPTSYCVASQQ